MTRATINAACLIGIALLLAFQFGLFWPVLIVLGIALAAVAIPAAGAVLICRAIARRTHSSPAAGGAAAAPATAASRCGPTTAPRKAQS